MSIHQKNVTSSCCGFVATLLVVTQDLDDRERESEREKEVGLPDCQDGTCGEILQLVAVRDVSVQLLVTS